MTPLSMAGWNLALWFVLELVAPAGLTAAAWKPGSGPTRWIAAAGAPVATG